MTSKVSPFDVSLSNRVKDLRTQAKLTQPQVASHLGITYQSYQKMEGGKHSFRARTVVQLAELYNLSVQELLDGTVSVDPTKSRCHYLIEGFGQSQLESARESLIRINNEEQ